LRGKNACFCFKTPEKIFPKEGKNSQNLSLHAALDKLRFAGNEFLTRQKNLIQ
jgi:hypothetical protein